MYRVAKVAVVPIMRLVELPVVISVNSWVVLGDAGVIPLVISIQRFGGRVDRKGASGWRGVIFGGFPVRVVTTQELLAVRGRSGGIQFQNSLQWFLR